MEAPTYALCQSLPASTNVLSSLSMVAIGPLFAPGITGTTGSYENKLVVPEVQPYKFENIRSRVSAGYQSTTCLLRTGITYV